MKIQVKTMIWRLMLVIMTLVFWFNLVAAQEEAEAAEEAVNFGPIWFILSGWAGGDTGAGLLDEFA